MRTRLLHASLIGLSLLLAGSARAVTIYGLTGANGLVRFDSATPNLVTNVGPISQAGIVDIDVSPANGRLYGISGSGSLYFIDPATGAATLAVAPASPLADVTDLDFNPAADRARVFGLTDQNYRIIPDASAITAPQTGTPGMVIVDGTWTNTGVDLVGSAYTNNVNNAASTVLYSIDTAGDALIVHSVAPQFNTVAAVGGFGVAVGSNVGFDIDAGGFAWLSDDSKFYGVNLATGALSFFGTIGYAAYPAGVVSIAAVPEPGTLLLATSGIALLAGFRKRA